MPLIRLTSGTSFSAAADRSILDAAIAAGVSLPYSCRTGRCGTCKCLVTDGETKTLLPETGLEAGDAAEGWVLSCARAAVGDVTLDVDDLGGRTLPQPKTLPCRIHTLERLGEDVVRVLLRLPPTADFTHLPGQYVDVIGFGGVRRSYSLANAPAENKLLELQIRRVPGGAMSEYWFGAAAPNDLLRLHGPFGTFFLRDVAGRDLVFLATGTGFAPVKAMLEGMAGLPPTQVPRSVTVYWGGRRAADLYWDVGALGIGRYVPVLSRADPSWEGRRGHVQDVFLADRPNTTDAAVYACGSEAMIRDAQRSLRTAGLPANRFYSDAFVCSSTEFEP